MRVTVRQMHDRIEGNRLTLRLREVRLVDQLIIREREVEHVPLIDGACLDVLDLLRVVGQFEVALISDHQSRLEGPGTLVPHRNQPRLPQHSGTEVQLRDGDQSAEHRHGCAFPKFRVRFEHLHRIGHDLISVSSLRHEEFELLLVGGDTLTGLIVRVDDLISRGLPCHCVLES